MTRGCRIPLTGAGAIALSMLAVGCASTGGTPRPFPMPSKPAVVEPPSTPTATPTSAPTATPTLDTSALVQKALDLRGVPYRSGGSDLSGFDCSGFTQYVFALYGLVLPREVRDQYAVGSSVNRRNVAQGDLIFFSTTEPGPSHVAIALGADEFVHAPSSTGVVRIERLDSPYWSRRFVGVRRLPLTLLTH